MIDLDEYERNRVKQYVDAMRDEANRLRVKADKETGDQRNWTLSRADYFDECADEAMARSNNRRL